MPGKQANQSAIRYIRPWIISIYVALIAGGGAFAFVHLDDGPKYFVSGLLAGAGFAGVLAEVLSAPDRRESERRLDELRGSNVASYRLAYAMGEFVWGFYAHLSKHETTHHEVTQFVQQGELLGIGDSLQAMVAQASSSSATINFDDVKRRVEQALAYKGQHLEAFFDIGWHLLALRGDDAKAEAAARNKVGADLSAELDAVSGVIVGVSPYRAWKNIDQLWSEQKLPDQQVDKVLLALHAFFKFLEDDQKAYQRFKHMVDVMGKKEFVENPEKTLRTIDDELGELGL